MAKQNRFVSEIFQFASEIIVSYAKSPGDLSRLRRQPTLEIRADRGRSLVARVAENGAGLLSRRRERGQNHWRARLDDRFRNASGSAFLLS